MDCELSDSAFGSSVISCIEKTRHICVPSFFVAGEYFCILEDWRGREKCRFRVKNGVTQQGMQYIIGSAFPATGPTPAQITSWYLGLIVNTGTPFLAASDTHGSHSGWSELTASGNISDSTRPQWNIVAGGSTPTYTATSSTSSDYNFINTASIYGMFLTNMATLGSTDASKIIASTAAYPTPQAVANGDKLKTMYTMYGTLT